MVVGQYFICRVERVEYILRQTQKHNETKYGLFVVYARKMTNIEVSRSQRFCTKTRVDHTKIPHEYFLMCQRYDQRFIVEAFTIDEYFFREI